MGVATAPLVGRADELALLEGALAELTRGEWEGMSGLLGEPGIGKTRLLVRARRPSRTPRPARALGLRLGARTRPAVLGVRGRARRVRPRVSTRACSTSLDEDVRTELGNVFPSLSRARGPGRGGAPARALPHPPRGARAARAARCDHDPRARCSTTSTGPTRPPSSCSARCSAGRRRRRYCSPRGPPAAGAGAAPRHSTARTAPGPSPASTLRR